MWGFTAPYKEYWASFKQFEHRHFVTVTALFMLNLLMSQYSVLELACHVRPAHAAVALAHFLMRFFIHERALIAAHGMPAYRHAQLFTQRQCRFEREIGSGAFEINVKLHHVSPPAHHNS